MRGGHASASLGWSVDGGCTRIVQKHIHSTGVWVWILVRGGNGPVDGQGNMRFKVMAEEGLSSLGLHLGFVREHPRPATTCLEARCDENI